MRPLFDIIADVIAGINRTVIILDSQDNGDGTTTIQVCDVKYAEISRSITIGGENYVIRNIDANANTITVTTGSPITDTTFGLYEPVYFRGTASDTEKEVKEIVNFKDRTPMVFLLVPFSERKLNDVNSSVERESRFTLFFLTKAEHDTWPTGDILENAVYPMDRLKELFIDSLKAMPGTFYTEEIPTDETPRIKFGVYVTNAGVNKSMFAPDLSGVQVDFAGLQIFEQPTPEGCECV